MQDTPYIRSAGYKYYFTCLYILETSYSIVILYSGQYNIGLQQRRN